MKKSFIATLVMLGFEALSIFPSAALQAQMTAGDLARFRDSVSANIKLSGYPAKITFLGADEDMVLFHVTYANPEGDKFTIFVRDQDHDLLYTQTYNDKSFSKQFRLQKADKSQITFTIRNAKKEDITKTFQINVNTRLIEDVAVRKLK